MHPDTVDFGPIPVGGNYFGKLIYFANGTGGSITMDSPYIGGQAGNPFAWFSNIIGQFTAGDGFELTYGVRFRPPWEGPFEDDLCIPVVSLPNPCVHLRGRGTAPLTGTVFQGETATLTTSIPNPGFQALDLRIRTAKPWSTPLPSSAVVPAGDSLEVTIALNASALESGVYRDTMRVEAVGVYYDYVLPYEVTVGNPVANEARPTAQTLGEPFPNPTSGTVTIPLTLEAPATVAVEVYDVRGQRVFDAGARPYAAGRHALTVATDTWAGGTYYIRMAAQSAAGKPGEVRRFTVVR